APAGIYTVIVEAKKGATYHWIGLGFGAGTHVDGAYFDLNAGVIGGIAAGTTAKIVALADGFFRCAISRSLLANAGFGQIEIHTANNETAAFIGDGTGIYVEDAQFVAGTWLDDPSAVTQITVTLPFSVVPSDYANFMF